MNIPKDVHDEGPRFPYRQEHSAHGSHVAPDKGYGNPPSPVGLGEVLLS
jgi:hypothetical protein